MRDAELKQMRKDKVTVRNGHLAGKLLADILEADLMEVDASMKQDYLNVIEGGVAEPLAA